jgi:predicted ATPase
MLDKESVLMLEHIEIKNFKSILQAKIKFSPLTVLVGMNGAGKSNLTLALAFLSHVSTDGLAAAVNHFGGFRNLLPQMEDPSRSLPVGQEAKSAFCVSMSLPPSQAKQADSPLTVKYELEFGYADLAKESVRITHEKMSFDLSEAARTDKFLSPAGILLASPDFTAQARTFRTRVSAIRRYNLRSTSKPIEQSQNGGETSAAEPFVLSSIRQPAGEVSWNRIMRTLGVIAPYLNLIQSDFRYTEEIELSARKQIESWELSGGMVRALAILLALETHPEHGTLLIEEPEQSLHPWAIKALMEHVREVIRERNIQVILTTHSPIVLEELSPEEVLIVERSEQKGTTFQTIHEILPDHKIAMGEVGELWIHGLLGGVPSYE